MLKRQNINLNSFGKINCLLLFCLVALVISPIAYSPDIASAADVTTGGATSGDSDFPTSTPEPAPATVNISLTPTSGTTTITPTTSEGSLARIDVKADIDITNTGGYSIYLSSKNTNLTGEQTGATISAATSTTTFQDLQTNTWGYTAIEGTTIPDSANYSALPVTGITLKNEAGNKNSAKHTYMFSFAAKIGNDKPADIYKNQITLSATVSPKVLTLSQLTNMQDITTASCAVSAIGETKQLRDVRDGKYYWVAKLADQRCWMTQNLDLDLAASTTPLTPATSDVSADWTPGDAGKNPAYTETTATSSTIYANSLGQRSWDLGNYRLINPTSSSSSCGSPKNNASQCSSVFTSYTTPTTANNDANAHYILGNFYQWNAATAGTGDDITSDQATSSICPKGWKLPESNATTAGTFGSLLDAYSIGADVAKAASSPLYFVRGGGVSQTTNNLFYGGGNKGRYWSSTPDSGNKNQAYTLFFSTTNSIGSSGSLSRQDGFSVRCLAR